AVREPHSALIAAVRACVATAARDRRDARASSHHHRHLHQGRVTEGGHRAGRDDRPTPPSPPRLPAPRACCGGRGSIRRPRKRCAVTLSSTCPSGLVRLSSTHAHLFAAGVPRTCVRVPPRTQTST